MSVFRALTRMRVSLVLTLNKRPLNGIFPVVAGALSWVLAGMGSVSAQDIDAAALIHRVAHATENLTYDGTFVYQRGGQLDAMRIVHKFENGSERERLISLSGPAREVIRDGSRVTCLFADGGEVMVEKREPRDFLSLGLSEPVERLRESYIFGVIGRDRVAARDAVVVDIVPKEKNRYAYRLWIDNEYGLLLKSVILDRAGQPLEQIQFVQIDITDTLSDKLFATEIEGTGFTWYTNDAAENTATRVVETSGWTVNWVPAGFQMRNHQVQSMSASAKPVSHMVYSDGLAMVSVFVEELMDSSQPLQGFSSMGAVNAFSRVEKNHQITVVGEVPLPTVRQIASSVQHQH